MLTEVPSSYKTPDGKWHHHIRQSDLVTFAQCPELHRRQMLGTTIDMEGDSAIIGSACHEAYASATNMIKYNLQDASQIADIMSGVARDYLADTWLKSVEENNLRQVQIASIEEAWYLINKCLIYWVQDVFPWLIQNPDLIESVEQSFDFKVFEDDKRVIYLTGTWDLGFAGQLFDYKHSRSQKYSKQKAWQLSRYHPQATHYAWAYDMLMDGDSLWEFPDDSELAPFSFININPDKGVEIIGPDDKDSTKGVVIRTVGDCRFHLELMKSLAYLIEAELPVWPLGPSDWWCSSKWCSAWNDCRGKFIGPDPWNLIEKATEVLNKRRAKQ